MCKATSAISQYDTLSSSNLTAVSPNALNDLNAGLASLNGKIPQKYDSTKTTTSTGAIEITTIAHDRWIAVKSRTADRIAFDLGNGWILVTNNNFQPVSSASVNLTIWYV